MRIKWIHLLKFILAACLTSILLAGCVWMLKPKIFPLSPCEVTVASNVIYCSGKPFAELRCFNEFDTNNMNTPLSETTRGCSGLVIYYYDNDKEVWIHPKERLSVYRDGTEHTKIYDNDKEVWIRPKVYREGTEYTKIEDMKRVWVAFHQEFYVSDITQIKWAYIYIGGKPWGKEEAIRSRSYEVNISDDGRSVSYKTQGMIYNSSHKYLVEYGISEWF